MRRLTGLLVLATLVAGGALAQDDARPPFELARPQEGDGPLSAYRRLADAEVGLRESPPAGDWLAQTLAQRAGALGLHAEALRWEDGRPFAPRWDSVGTLPEGIRAVDAVAEIARRAASEQVVMVNEAHHDASTRLLTLALLGPLYERGYRYFAAETFAPDSVLAAQPPYPTAATGYYTTEPVFGAIVREALRLGYTLVPYEIEDEERDGGDSLTFQQRRDLTQAQHLAERVFAADPGARVLVHAGYSHVNEEVGQHFHPMARYFRDLTGIDPLTVDQTEVGPRSMRAAEHPAYRAAVVAGLVGAAPVVLLDADGTPLAPFGYEAFTDLQVFRPAVERPVASLGYGAVRSFSLPAACGPCVVEARRADEGSEAVPVDQRVGEGEVGLLGPRDVPLVVTAVDGTTGRVLDRRIVTAH